MPTDKVIGFAVGTELSRDLAMAICRNWDSDNSSDFPVDSARYCATADPKHQNPIKAGTLYKIAVQNGWKWSGQAGKNDVQKVKPPPFPIFSQEELDNAKPHPKCIVENYLYADLGLIAAPGGTGKTTTIIYEAVHIALGRPLWGLTVWSPGPVLFITAEDPRELFAARLKSIMDTMELSPYERSKALARIAVWDVTGEMVRLAELDPGGNIQLTGLADDIVEAYKEKPPAMVVFDPCVSFGPGERVVNDGEQAIVTACRRIIRGLGCCVRIVHHTGKANAREGALDQYASRGGTALPDGARMVAILAAVTNETSGAPEGFDLQPGESGFVMARPKLSYGPPQPNLWIRRRGYHFEHFTERKASAEQRAEAGKRQTEADAAAILKYLATELQAGRKHNPSTLEPMHSEMGMTRARVRTALAKLISARHVMDAELPEGERQGRKKTYLQPVQQAADNSAGDFGGIDPEAPIFGPAIPPSNSAEFNSAAYRERRNGGIEFPPSPFPVSNSAERNLAEFGGIGGIAPFEEDF